MGRLHFLLTAFFLLSGCSGTKSAKDDFFTSDKGKADYLKAYNQSLRLWDVPFKETDIKTKFGSAHVIISGPENGDPMVLLHGMDASSTMWFPNIKAFSKKYRTYAIDFPLEAGKSVANVKKMNKEEIADFYNEIFGHFKLNDINLVAASRGSWPATFIAMQPGHKIRKMVLFSPAQVLGNINSKAKVFPALMLKLKPTEKRLNKTFESFSSYPHKIDKIFKKQFFLANKYWRNSSTMLPLSTFSDKDLQLLDMPVLILIGDRDIINDRDNIERAAKLITHADTATIADSGHFLTIDQSAIVNKKVIDFLNRK